MGFVLKQYQRDCLDRLTDFLRRARESGNADTAFWEMTRRNPVQPPEELQGMPYVCLKVPTGGGKTFLAAHAVKPACEHWLQRERGVVLWLAPTTQIVDQTLDALRTPGHPYREALNEAFDGQVSVYDLGGALHVTPQVLSGSTTIIVTTIQALRVDDTEGRKVYSPNGELKHHFDGLTPDQREALFAHAAEDEDPTIPSLANVLRMNRPAVVVDEAHNARTDLSFETLRRFWPGCVLELTATPADDSNVLYAVSAARLKAAQMIKLPVMLRARKHARDAVASAVHKRKELAELAEHERAQMGYVRPVVLYQAQSGSGELNVDGVKKLLVDELNISAERVAICTGSTDELPDEPIISEKNPVEHIITVQKLREGWDCPFAYVLCSVANLGAKTAVEQLLGRVLRMPYARRREHEDLNQAYCYATSEDFQAAATDLESALVDTCGFTRHEARKMVRREPNPSGGGGGLFDESPEPVTIDLSGELDTAKLPEAVREFVSTTPRSGGGHTLIWTGGGMDDEQQAAITAALSDQRDRLAGPRLRRRSWKQDDSPADLGVQFKVPTLAVKEDGQWFVLEDQPYEADWSLADANYQLTESEFKVADADKRVAKFDVSEKGSVRTSFLDDLDQQVHLFERSDRDTSAKLANWLDRHIRETSLPAADKRAFLLHAVEDLIERRGIELPRLDRHRHMLKEALASKIAALRLNAERTAYQHMLDSDGFGVSMDCCITFPMSYPANKLCDADFDWQKHYYPTPAAMNGDELQVAKYLDSLPQVMHWVRNLEGEHHADSAFWLRKPHGRFFPDFVAELVGETFLVVEFKGDHLAESPDQQEKRRVGEMWAAASPDDLGFVWALKGDWREKIDAEVERLVGR